MANRLPQRFRVMDDYNFIQYVRRTRAEIADMRTPVGAGRDELIALEKKRLETLRHYISLIDELYQRGYREDELHA